MGENKSEEDCGRNESKDGMTREWQEVEREGEKMAG